MLNLSLSGCGFLGIYHIGVISAFREHAPDIIQNNKISGCSAGALVAACVACDCCLGQMVSDVLEIALKARSHALGPLHPSFNIVDILRNGLRRILPVDAHKICSGRVHVSLTRWKDGKNLIVNQFESREDLIQALICSSFVPCYSGFVPPKFRGTYYWDGGLSNNNPILDQDTIIVSPFGGEADICPRDESSAFYCYDFQGTNLHWSYENFYRISKALFPPNPQVLKAICFRGYKDAINFLKSRNLLECSCNRSREVTSISSVIGEDLHAYNMFDSNVVPDNKNVYEEDSEEEEDLEEKITYHNEPLNYQEMPTAVCEILDVACADDKGLINYVYASKLSRAISIMFLPWLLPIEFSLNFTKRFLELIPKVQVPTHSTNLLDNMLIVLNYLIQRFTYDKYQYHARVSCQLCIPSSRSRNTSQSVNSIQFNVCCHENNNENGVTEDDNKVRSYEEYSSDTRSLKLHNIYYPKMCARHRVPSICSSETGQLQYKRKARRNRSYVSNHSDLASSVDLNEFKSCKSFARRKTASSHLALFTETNTIGDRQELRSPKRNLSERLDTAKQLKLYNKIIENEALNLARVNTISTSSNKPTKAQNGNRVHFNLSDNEENTHDQVISQSTSELKDRASAILTNQLALYTSSDDNMSVKDEPSKTKTVESPNTLKELESDETYWDKLEFNVAGQINI